MSYQIKSTPFFQRIVATSKQSGELQKLKEEYDRIKIFNEKTLEVKVRQARLKRLFQEIEEIKETSIKKRRLTPAANATPAAASAQATKLSVSHDQRAKAKDLGQYYSNLNASRKDGINDLQYYRSKAFQNLMPKQKAKQVAAGKEVKERINKRAAYGNCISNWNMHRMLMGKLRNEVSDGSKCIGKPTSSHTSTSNTSSAGGKDKLKYRISYGNTISDLNMLMMPKRKSRSNLSHASLEPPRKPENAGVSPIITALSDVTIRPVSTTCASQGQLQDYLVIDNGAVQPLYPCDPSALGGRTKFQKYVLYVQVLLSVVNCIKRRLLAKSVEDSDEVKQFELRSISNDTNLLTSTTAPETCDDLDLSENEEEYIHHAMLYEYEAQNLSDTQSSNVTSYFSATTTEPGNQLPSIAQKRFHSEAIPRDRASMEPKHQNNFANVIKFFEPSSRQMVDRKLFNTGIQKIKEVFEHRNKSV